ncbi:putative PEP-binding protein [Dickeya undicola]|uniref:putative PEP-binding protein n=1 Tax=Dickeya undicola TaxID=1577887 RepID=UPI003F697A9D
MKNIISINDMQSIESKAHEDFDEAFLRTEYYIRKSKSWIDSLEFKKSLYSDIRQAEKKGYKRILLRAPDIQLNELAMYDSRFSKEDNSIIGHRGIRIYNIYKDYFSDFSELYEEIIRKFTLSIDIVWPYVTQLRECDLFKFTSSYYIMVETPALLVDLVKNNIRKEIKGYIIGLNDLYSLYFGASRQVSYYRKDMSELISFTFEMLEKSNIEKKNIYWAGYHSKQDTLLISKKGFENIIIDQKTLTCADSTMDQVWGLYDKELKKIRRML